MILSDLTIQEFIHVGKIKIFPSFQKEDIRPAGIRLHLGKDLLIPLPNQTIDLGASENPRFEKKEISAHGFLLKPGHFVLGSTYESFQVPRNMVCHVEGRSTIARIGLAIHCTSGIIDGNFEEPRTIVLEMHNQGSFDILLRYKTPIAMLSFSQLTTEIDQGMQKQYLGQDSVAPPNFKLQKK